MKKKLGVITIGQSPRDDILTEMRPYIGNNVEIIQSGALDGLTYEEILVLEHEEDNNILITKLRNGKTVNIAENLITSRIQECIYKLEEQEVDLILLMCTGVFPDVFISHKPILYPQKILHGVIPYLSGEGKIAIITPEKDQIEFYQKKWNETGGDIFVLHGSPYGDMEELDRVISALGKHENVDLIVLDCMGYTQDMKLKIFERTNIPVILAKTLIARLIGEMFSE